MTLCILYKYIYIQLNTLPLMIVWCFYLVLLFAWQEGQVWKECQGVLDRPAYYWQGWEWEWRSVYWPDQWWGPSCVFWSGPPHCRLPGKSRRRRWYRPWSWRGPGWGWCCQQQSIQNTGQSSWEKWCGDGMPSWGRETTWGIHSWQATAVNTSKLIYIIIYYIYVCVYLSIYIYPNLSFIYLAPPCRTRQSRMLGRWCRMSWKSSNAWLDLWRNSLDLDQRKPQRPSSYIHLISNMHVLACQKQNRLLESNCKFCLTFFHPKHAFWGVLSRWRTTGRSSWSTTMSLPIWSLTLTHARVSLTKGPFPEI